MRGCHSQIIEDISEPEFPVDMKPRPERPKYVSPTGEPVYVDHREPFTLFGKTYVWTLFDKEWNMTDTLHLVRYEAYREVIQRNLRLATLQGHI